MEAWVVGKGGVCGVESRRQWEWTAGANWNHFEMLSLMSRSALMWDKEGAEDGFRSLDLKECRFATWEQEELERVNRRWVCGTTGMPDNCRAGVGHGSTHLRSLLLGG